MDALFLHLDEELYNNRPGRVWHRPRLYAPSIEDVVFLCQLYSLFHDSVFVPINFLTDFNGTPKFLEALEISHLNSPLVTEDGPFKILWDTSRFHGRNVKDLLGEMEEDETYVSLRDVETSYKTAELLDKYFPENRITRVNMTADLDPIESVEQLRNEVFNLSENKAQEPYRLEKAANCLKRIVERGEQVGYGRNFYYTLWGYNQSDEGQKVAQRFADIISENEDIRSLFLTGVDYVSNRLKAKFASKALGSPIDVLIPDEYRRVVLRPDKAVTLAAGTGFAKQYELVPPEKYRLLIRRTDIVGLTGRQLASFHASDEYREFRYRLHELRTPPYDPEDEKKGKAVEVALSAYLERISKTLNPKRDIVDKTIGAFVAVVPTILGISVSIGFKLMGLLTAGEPSVYDTASESFSNGIELFSAHIADPILESTTRQETWPRQFHSFELSEDVKVYLRKQD